MGIIMDNMILYAALTVVLTVGLGLLFNKLVVKNYPEPGRKGGYTSTFIIFILMAGIIFTAAYIKIKVDTSVKAYAAEIERDIKKNYSNIDIVRNGIDVAAISKDVSKLNDTVNDLTRIVKPDELGIPDFVWEIALGYVKNELKKIIYSFNTVVKAANPFLDDRNFLTVSSLVNGIRAVILKIIKIVFIIIVSICALILLIYVLASISKASREKKRIKSQNAP
jgi:hypothetical protein